MELSKGRSWLPGEAIVISNWELSVPPPTSSFAYPGSELTLWLLGNCIVYFFFFLIICNLQTLAVQIHWEGSATWAVLVISEIVFRVVFIDKSSLVIFKWFFFIL